MNWQDIVISIGNVGFLVSLLPLFLTTVFKIEKRGLNLTTTAFMTASFLFPTGAAVMSLGATFGGFLMILNGVVWLLIGIASYKQKGK